MSSRALAATFGGLLVVALLVIAFLLGRESRAPEPVAPAAPVVAPPVSADEPAEHDPAPVREEPAEQREIAVEDDGTRLEQRGGELIISNTERDDRAAEAPAPVREAAPSGDRAALSAYLDQLDDLEAGPTTDNPQQFAQQLASSAMSGDTSQLDSLAKDIARAEAKARALSPPSEASAFHSQVIAQLAESREMIERLSDAFAAKDPNALTSLVDRAKTLEDRAREIESTKKDLERRAGR